MSSRGLVPANHEWLELQRRRRERDALRVEIDLLQRRQHKEEQHLAELNVQLARTERGTQKLVSLSLPALFHAVLGTKQHRLDQEHQQLLATQLAADVCRDSLARLDAKLSDLHGRLAGYADVEDRLNAHLHAKARQLVQSQLSSNSDLLRLAEQVARLHADLDRVKRLKATGSTALLQLIHLATACDHSEAWDTADLPANDPAHGIRPLAHHAHESVEQFAAELAAAEQRFSVKYDAHQLLGFGSRFFHCVIEDVASRRRTNDASQLIEQTRRRIAMLLDILDYRLRDLTEQTARLESTLRTAIEQA